MNFYRIFMLNIVYSQSGAFLSSVSLSRVSIVKRVFAENRNSPGPPEDLLDSYLKDSNVNKAIETFRQNPELEFNRQRWAACFDAIERSIAKTDEGENLEKTISSGGLVSGNNLAGDRARSEMTTMYTLLKQLNHLRLFGAAEDFPLASGSHIVTPKLLEAVSGLDMVALTPKRTNPLLVAGAASAFLEGLVSLYSGIDFNILASATLLLFLLDKAFTNGAIFQSFLQFFFPELQKRVVRHEAGHFLVAYLLGLPVEGCVLNAWDALQDKRFEKREISAATSFFDPALLEQMKSSIVTRSSIDRYSVVVMAGIAAEAIDFGRAEGGSGDEVALVSFLSQLNGDPKRGTNPPWNGATIRNQARWGALQAVLLLRQYKDCYEALVNVLEEGGTLGDCTYAIEKAGREKGLSPIKEPMGYILDEGPYGVWTLEKPKNVEKVPDPQGNTKKQSYGFSSDESLVTLEEYRNKMEDRLKAINSRLEELDN
mmetsp:Transcript_10434/g.16016  ORF Transcript_10434/g.16016 Transcript_10434/m.16016 type:complete len:484 (+) Transcript_10434:59-1510(+)